MENYSLCHVLREMIELLLVQYEEFKRKSPKSTLKIKVKCPQSQNVCSEMWFLVQVSCSLLPSYSNKLVELISDFCPTLYHYLRMIQQQFVGDFMTFHTLDIEHTMTNTLHIFWCPIKNGLGYRYENTKYTHRPSSAQLKIYGTVDELMIEIGKFKKYLHKLQFLHSKMDISLRTNIIGLSEKIMFRSGDNSYAAFRKHYLSTDVKCFLPLNSLEKTDEGGEATVLHGRGHYWQLRNVKFGSDIYADLRVTSVSLLAPTRPPFHNVSTQQVKVMLVGPACLPLVDTWLHLQNVHPSNILAMHPYRLVIGKRLEQDTLVEWDWCHELQALDECSDVVPPSESASNTGTACVNSSMANVHQASEKPVLHVLIMLESSCTQPQQTARDKLSLLRNLQNNLPSLLVRYRSKIRKAVASSANKLLFNFKTRNEKDKVVRGAIADMVDSITAVVTCSTNEAFTHACRAAFKSKSTTEFREKLCGGLWQLAEKCHCVTRDVSRIKHEATPTKSKRSRRAAMSDVEPSSKLGAEAYPSLRGPVTGQPDIQPVPYAKPQTSTKTQPSLPQPALSHPVSTVTDFFPHSEVWGGSHYKQIEQESHIASWAFADENVVTEPHIGSSFSANHRTSDSIPGEFDTKQCNHGPSTFKHPSDDTTYPEQSCSLQTSDEIRRYEQSCALCTAESAQNSHLVPRIETNPFISNQQSSCETFVVETYTTNTEDGYHQAIYNNLFSQGRHAPTGSLYQSGAISPVPQMEGKKLTDQDETWLSETFFD